MPAARLIRNDGTVNGERRRGRAVGGAHGVRDRGEPADARADDGRGALGAAGRRAASRA